MRKLLYAMAMAVLALSANVQAAYTVNINQVGPDVVATGTGSFNLSALTLNTSNVNQFTYMIPASALAVVGSAATRVDLYRGQGPPTSAPAGPPSRPVPAATRPAGAWAPP